MVNSLTLIRVDSHCVGGGEILPLGYQGRALALALKAFLGWMD
jgi:hypothetical protein